VDHDLRECPWAEARGTLDVITTLASANGRLMQPVPQAFA
jgi:hypothetical protein